MRMDGYSAFKFHHAINLHFNGTYDCFKYNFKTNVTEKTYWKRPDKFQLTKIGKRFKSRDDIILNIVVIWYVMKIPIPSF